jgi:hypothetical protein
MVIPVPILGIMSECSSTPTHLFGHFAATNPCCAVLRIKRGANRINVFSSCTLLPGFAIQEAHFYYCNYYYEYVLDYQHLLGNLVSFLLAIELFPERQGEQERGSRAL